MPVRLADGQEWAFPGPRELSPEGTTSDRELSCLLAAIASAEDAADCRRMELALAIHLISLNYALCSDDYFALLDGNGDQAVQEQLQWAFRDLARRHAAALAPFRAECAPEPATGRRFRLPRFRPIRRLAARMTATLHRAAS